MTVLCTGVQFGERKDYYVSGFESGIPESSRAFVNEHQRRDNELDRCITDLFNPIWSRDNDSL